jgi:hypothetical protein
MKANIVPKPLRLVMHPWEIKAFVDGKLTQIRRPLDPQPGDTEGPM